MKTELKEKIQEELKTAREEATHLRLKMKVIEEGEYRKHVGNLLSSLGRAQELMNTPEEPPKKGRK